MDTVWIKKHDLLTRFYINPGDNQSAFGFGNMSTCCWLTRFKARTTVGDTPPTPPPSFVRPEVLLFIRFEANNALGGFFALVEERRNTVIAIDVEEELFEPLWARCSATMFDNLGRLFQYLVLEIFKDFEGFLYFPRYWQLTDDQIIFPLLL